MYWLNNYVCVFYSGFNFRWMNRIECSVGILIVLCFFFITSFPDCREKLTMYNNNTSKNKNNTSTSPVFTER